MWKSFLISILIIWCTQTVNGNSIENIGIAKNYTFIVNSKTYVLSTGNKVTASGALKGCAAINAKLLSIETEEESDIITKKITDYLVDRSSQYWTSGFRTSEDKWTWLGTGELINFTNWGPFSPNNVDGDQNCIKIMKISSQPFGTWIDVSCDSYYEFICEF